MIGYLRGILISKQPPLLVLDVNGVGYEIQASMNTFYVLPAKNEQTQLLIHMVVREDAQLLYGFATSEERHLFRTLIKVNGVGPKLALTILSGISVQQFIECVHRKDMTSLVNIPGIGKKTAERLIIETRDAVTDFQLSLTDEPISVENNLQQSLQDAISALTTLGYKPHEAKTTIQQLSHQTDNTEDLIRLGLQSLLKGGK